MLFNVDTIYAGAREAAALGNNHEAAELYLRAAVLIEATGRSIWTDAVFERALAAEKSLDAGRMT